MQKRLEPESAAAAGSGRPHVRAERGQVLVLVAAMLVLLLGVAAIAIDVGYAYYGKRALQVSADAAALAGAAELPNQANAKSVALQFSASSGGKNERRNIPGVETSVGIGCIPATAKCSLMNTV